MWQYFRGAGHYNDLGFGYENYNGSANYGISMAKPSFVIDLVQKTTNLTISSYQEKGWDYHHDVVVCFKDAHFSDQYFNGKYIFK